MHFKLNINGDNFNYKYYLCIKIDLITIKAIANNIIFLIHTLDLYLLSKAQIKNDHMYIKENISQSFSNKIG